MTRTCSQRSFDAEVVDWLELAGGGSGLRKGAERRKEKSGRRNESSLGE